MIDIRCGETNHVTRLCCQLQIGHGGPHATMAADSSHRVIYTWTEPLLAPRPETASMAHLHSWAPGYPAVHEGVEMSDSQRVIALTLSEH